MVGGGAGASSVFLQRETRRSVRRRVGQMVSLAVWQSGSRAAGQPSGRKVGCGGQSVSQSAGSRSVKCSVGQEESRPRSSRLFFYGNFRLVPPTLCDSD